MSDSLAPSLLLAMPQMMDPNFARTVVLLCRHGAEGAFGLVVNRPLPSPGQVVFNLDPPVETGDVPLWVGGPVEPERSWILVGGRTADALDPDEGLSVSEGLSLSTSPDLLRTILTGTPPPYTKLVVGYAGWAPGQLESEFETASWLMSDVDIDLLFNTPADRMWEAAIRRLGADPATLQTSRGVH